MNDTFLKACRREPVQHTPVWLMRQAGRYMATYRALRARYSILELIKNPELAVEVTMQPVDAYPLDAAIIFADILTLPEAMGLKLEFIENKGPVIHNPLRTEEDIQRLTPIEPREALSFTMDAVRLASETLKDRIPLIGFSGAPFTMACYAIEGGSSRNFIKAKSWMHADEKSWHHMMHILAEAAGQYLAAQLEAGASAVQVFDSWAGILSPRDYKRYVLPHTQRTIALAKEIKPDAPVIHFGTDTATLLPLIRESGADVIGLDWRVNLAEAWDELGPEFAVQGNLDPVILFSEPEVICAETSALLKSVKDRPGYIFNLGHGVLQHTPESHVGALVDFVHSFNPS
jgi:uroporphyrinogen decarboxylase